MSSAIWVCRVGGRRGCQSLAAWMQSDISPASRTSSAVMPPAEWVEQR
ncbi:MAG: hypothetical protein QOD82_2871, partial [Pseudonocardiales bacterium]|nr:hypothetical protein [Pseudonocardiales bacterium]